MNAPKTPKTYAEAIALFDRALTLDPRPVEAQSRLAIHRAGRAHAEMTDSVAADTCAGRISPSEPLPRGLAAMQVPLQDQ